MYVDLIFLGHLLPQTENNFDCSRHQRLVTIAFRRCVHIFLLTYLLILIHFEHIRSISVDLQSTFYWSPQGHTRPYYVKKTVTAECHEVCINSSNITWKKLLSISIAVLYSTPHIIAVNTCRAGLVWIFQLRFDFQSQVLSFSFFFSFGIHTSPHRRSILVCENTKTESTYFDGNSFTLGMSRWMESRRCCLQPPSFIVDLNYVYSKFIRDLILSSVCWYCSFASLLELLGKLGTV